MTYGGRGERRKGILPLELKSNLQLAMIIPYLFLSAQQHRWVDLLLSGTAHATARTHVQL